MSHTTIPQGYQPLLGLYDTQKAIGLTKRLFEDALSGALNLRRVSAPLFVEAASGLNDNLNGVERPVSFTMKEGGGDDPGGALAGQVEAAGPAGLRLLGG